MSHKTDFFRALRPFSLIVAIATCGLGASLALLEGSDNIYLAGLVIFTGIVLQAAVNLINDYRDLQDHELTPLQQLAILRNTKIGWALILLVIALGLIMVSIRGWPLLLLGITGLFAAWAYTGGTVNYKTRGLGVLLVFFLMGILLIGGSYYVVTGSYHRTIFWLSIPFSLLSSLLLLSNELRDYEQDLSAGIKTLTVRIGYTAGVKLYYWLLILLYLTSVLLFLSGIIDGIILLLATIAALWQALKLLHTPHPQRMRLTPLTGRFYFIFSIAYIVTIWLPVL